MDFLQQADIKDKYGIKHNISHKMVCQYLQALGYHYQFTLKGQYIDRHKREDVVTYRKPVFCPKWKKFMDQVATWDKDHKEHLPSGEGRWVIVWFFWQVHVLCSQPAKRRMVPSAMWRVKVHPWWSPILYQQTLAGSLLLMENDQHDASLSWEKIMMVTFQMKTLSGKQTRQSTFSANITLSSTTFSSTTMQQHPWNMLRTPSLHERCQRAPQNLVKIGGSRYSSTIQSLGKTMYRSDRSVEKMKILMKDGCFENGKPQPLYFPIDHPNKDLWGGVQGHGHCVAWKGNSNFLLSSRLRWKWHYSGYSSCSKVEILHL